MEVAIMFTLYETAGVVTNLLAGIAGAKWGIKFTLLFGLSFQFVGLGMLYGWNPAWEKSTAIIYVTIAQMMSGISKDLTKLGGKTVTKLVTPDEKQGQLFKLVSWSLAPLPTFPPFPYLGTTGHLPSFILFCLWHLSLASYHPSTQHQDHWLQKLPQGSRILHRSSMPLSSV